MTGLGETLGGPWPLLAIRPWAPETETRFLSISKRRSVNPGGLVPPLRVHAPNPPSYQPIYTHGTEDTDDY
jgi:hypothetical protein